MVIPTHLSANSSVHLTTAFAQDPQRFSHFSQSVALVNNAIFCDLSKNLIDRATEVQLIRRAAAARLEAKRDAMFAGELVNSTEGRAASHMRLRDPHDTTVKPVLDAMLVFAEKIRHHPTITDIVNIGIGGSDVGPAMVVQALDQHALPHQRHHFVANVDGHELHSVLRHLKPASTLFIIASKTFATLETMRNAHSAKTWFLAQGGLEPQIAQHFCAATTNLQAAHQFGIQDTFEFWDWVGGRYSLWSAIGLSIAIALGESGFRALLGGAHAIDLHFKTAPLAKNLPVRLGLLDVHYRNNLKISSRCIVPYSAALGRLPAYVQQLEMESNGKSVDKEGKPVVQATAPVIWGEAGTNGQHAFFQMLHQGSDVIPVEFIVSKTPTYSDENLHSSDHHPKLLANALAQAQALMEGSKDTGGHKHFAGNRPSTFMVLDALTPESLGALLALYEHRVFVSCAIWNINPFDQYGVELGKTLAMNIEPRLHSGDTVALDASTAGLIAHLRDF